MVCTSLKRAYYRPAPQGTLNSQTVVNYPGTEEHTASKYGLAALFELYNIEWLFILCIILFFVGAFIAFYPKLRSRRTKKKTDVR